MKFAITLLSLLLFVLNGNAQSPTTAELKALLEKEEYDKLIQQSSNTASYDAEALYYLAIAYYARKDNDKSLQYFNDCVTKDPKNTEALLYIAEIYADEKKTKQALETYYKVLSLAGKDDKSRSNTLFNVGMLEYQAGNFNKSISAYTELLRANPEDYPAYSKLIQVYYAQNQYDKAVPLKKKLYEAHAKGLLKENLRDMFCFDQFKWNGRLIQAFERYQDGPSENIYHKHRFYVVNEKDEVEYRIQTEYSPIAVEQGLAKYVLCKNQGNTHATYNRYFNDGIDYAELKASVIEILENKIQPVATSGVK